MNELPFRRYRLGIELLTPIHVGCGRTIEPYEYDLAEDDEHCWLVVLDVAAILAGVPAAQRAQFEAFSERADFPALRRWLQQHGDRKRHALWRVHVEEDAYHEIRRHINNPARLGEIHLFVRDAATGRPYLPGSSIKGAIRTAVVDAAARETPARLPQLEAIARRADRERRAAARFEAAALGNAGPEGRPDLCRDPLRQLAIADATLPEDACWIDRIQIVRSGGGRRSDPRGIVIYRDLAVPVGEPGTPLTSTELRVHDRLASRRRMGERALPRRLDARTICRMCNQFYVPRLEEELRRFRCDESTEDVLRGVAAWAGDTSCLIRLGRHSHFECVTVGEPFRRSPRRGFGNSRSYAGGQLPLGWIRLGLEAIGPP